MIIISSEKLNLRHIVHICKTVNNLYKSHLKISRKTVVNFTWYKGMGVGYTTYTFTIPVPPFNHIAETFVKFLYHIDTRTHCLTQHLYMCMHDCTHTHVHAHTYMHARTHACTHTHTKQGYISIMFLREYRRLIYLYYFWLQIKGFLWSDVFVVSKKGVW